MCGIFGCVGTIDYGKAIECVKRIRHRGPDSMAVVQLEGITLGHTRLAILDKDKGADQPMQDSSGRYTIVYNGEVYNFVELRRDLELKGYQFRTYTDTEVLLYSYIEWGEAFQQKCNGMWALAIWDDFEKRLFLSRDRFGIKPLYIYKKNGNFYFASEMKAFFPVMTERVPNKRIFIQKDYFNYEASNECSIVGIEKLAAGTVAFFENGSLEKKRWWNTLDHLYMVPKSYEEQVEMLRELFLDACKLRMRSDVPIGTALSGGIDSSCTIGAMSYLSESYTERKTDDWQHAFVAHMPGTVCDETRYAEIAARYIGISVNHVNINSCIKAEELLRYMYLCEDPYPNTSPVPHMQTYNGISNAGIKVTLDGHGADELFGGYRGDLFSACIDAGIGTKSYENIIGTFNEMSGEHISANSSEVIDRIKSNLKADNVYGIKNTYFDEMDEYNKRLYIQTHYRILPTLLRCYDKFSMASGVEIRMPFMDYRIVCFAFSIPWDSKVRNRYTKAIVRDMARPFMTKKILDRKQKIGFGAPCTEWFKGELKEFLLDIVYSKDFCECELVNAFDTRIDVNAFFKNEKADLRDGARIWARILPYLWKKAVIDCA